MKLMTMLLAAGWLALGAASAATQSPPARGTESPEIEYLRRLIAEQQKNPDKIIRTLPATNAPASTNTAPPRRPAPAPAKTEPPKTESPRTAVPARASETTDAVPTSEEAARQKKISEVEARLDEMLRQKEAREKAALTNATTTNKVSATPQSKRQRLDDLLKQMIDGKITGAEYNEKRARIVAEPD